MTHDDGQSVDDIILDSIADGVFTVDENWEITSFNRAAEAITGIPKAEAIGRRCCEVFRATICETECAIRRAMESGQPQQLQSVYIVNSEGERVPISVSAAVLRDRAGQVIGAVETFRDMSLVEELRKELTARHSFADIVSKNHQMLRIFDILPEIADSTSTVLIEGESGTGKELVARAIHNLGPRRDEAMVAVNCAALPDTLLESELFGYVAGAFTDAKKDKPGRFALAQGGTIFLDEIGDVSTAVQVRLLRVLQERTYEPLGATAPRDADVRVIAASNKDLASLVAQGAFRQDLFYRINVVKITLPPLRERKEDIPLLVGHFVARFNRIQNKDVAGVSEPVLARLMAHDFPGNVRELENLIERAFVLCRGGAIELGHLPEDFGRGRPETPTEQPLPHDPKAALAELEAQAIEAALRRNHGNRQGAADELGMHKTTLWRKIKTLGVRVPESDGRRRPS